MTQVHHLFLNLTCGFDYNTNLRNNNSNNPFDWKCTSKGTSGKLLLSTTLNLFVSDHYRYTGVFTAVFFQPISFVKWPEEIPIRWTFPSMCFLPSLPATFLSSLPLPSPLHKLRQYPHSIPRVLEPKEM